jgi:signal transduction histidine kinase
MPDPGFRPPWWPEGEPFPPRRHPHWGRRGRVFILIPIAFLVGIGFAIGRGTHGSWWWWPLGFLLLILIARTGRPRWFPVRRLVEAAGKLAAGDYSVRMPEVERGPMREVVRSFNGMARRLEETSAQRRRWLADLGHELRTPLTVIQGELEAIADGVHPADPEHLQRILDETRLMSRLLDDLRTLSLSEAGELRLEPEPIDVAGLLEDAAAPFRLASNGGRAAIEVVADPGTVTVDPVRLREVLTNLITNAVRHSPAEGRITIEARRQDSQWRFAVADQGPGIPAELLPEVFERFVRSHDSAGTGLGLSIARDLVRAHGGDMTASSEPGGGTRIEFFVPS